MENLVEGGESNPIEKENINRNSDVTASILLWTRNTCNFQPLKCDEVRVNEKSLVQLIPERGNNNTYDPIWIFF